MPPIYGPDDLSRRRAPRAQLHGAGAGADLKAMHARVVIIGGGVIGSSVAYHLAAAGEKSVVVIEARSDLSGSIVGAFSELDPPAVHHPALHGDVTAQF